MDPKEPPALASRHPPGRRGATPRPRASREYTLKFTPLRRGVAPSGEALPRAISKTPLSAFSCAGGVSIGCIAFHYSPLVRGAKIVLAPLLYPTHTLGWSMPRLSRFRTRSWRSYDRSKTFPNRQYSGWPSETMLSDLNREPATLGPLQDKT